MTGTRNDKISNQKLVTGYDYPKNLEKHYDSFCQHFVERYWTDLINRVSETGAILDKLLERGFISHERYGAVRSLTTPQDQMRDILTLVISAGEAAKDALYEILRGMKHLRLLISELEGSE
uniref:CARD domain-containing protein n=1 Tax=Monopterus albus TaxID=43700 RepID=A0A3Q3J2E5_MONAL